MTALDMVVHDPRVKHDKSATIVPMLQAYESAIAAGKIAPAPAELQIAIQAHRERLAREEALRLAEKAEKAEKAIAAEKAAALGPNAISYAIEHFVSKGDALACRCCSKSFGVRLWKYHCGGCGACVCDGCSQRRFVLLPPLQHGYSKATAGLQQGYRLDASGKSELRVCDGCPNPEMSPPSTLGDFCDRIGLKKHELLDWDRDRLVDALYKFGTIEDELREQILGEFATYQQSHTPRSMRGSGVQRHDHRELQRLRREKEERDIEAAKQASLDELQTFYHGTALEAGLTIQKCGFNVDLSGSNAGTMLGNGVYLTTTLGKAMSYTSEPPAGRAMAGTRPHGGCVLTLKVDLGKTKEMTRHDPMMRTWHEHGFDSAHSGDGVNGKMEEHCVRDAERVTIVDVVLGNTGKAESAGYSVLGGRLHKK